MSTTTTTKNTACWQDARAAPAKPSHLTDLDKLVEHVDVFELSVAVEEEGGVIGVRLALLMECLQTDGQREKQTDGQTERQTDEQTDNSQMDE